MIDDEIEDDEDLGDELGDELSADLAAMFGDREPDQGSRKPQASGLQDCPFEPCPDCGGPTTKQSNGYFNSEVKLCETCQGVGYIDVPVDNFTFLQHRPGSEVRVAMMTLRESLGLSLWTGRSPF